MGRLVIETRPPDFQSGVQAPAIRSTQIRAVDENRTRVSLCLGKAMCTSSYTTTALLKRAANQNRTGILCLEDRRTSHCAIAANYKFEVTIHKWIIAANYKLICGATLSRTRASGFSVQRANNHLHHSSMFARVEGFEPPTFGFGDQRYHQLS